MTTFTDLKRQEWNLAFTMEKALDASGTFDLLDIESVLEAMANPREFVRGLKWMVGSDEELSQFGQRFDGKVLEDARNALWAAIENFTPPERRAAIRGIKSESEKVAAEMLAMLERAIERNGSDLLSKLAGSLDSIPDASR